MRRDQRKRPVVLDAKVTRRRSMVGALIGSLVLLAAPAVWSGTVVAADPPAAPESSSPPSAASTTKGVDVLGDAPRRETAAENGQVGADDGSDGVVATADTIDRSSRASVRDAYLNWYLPQLAVPLGWTGNTSNCSAGSVSGAAQDATLSMINFFRAYAGVPAVSFDSTYSNKAQQAALMMAANNTLSHSPPSSWRCWTAQGAEAAGSSNLYLGRSGAASVAGYIVDPGSNNTAVGHRRWVLFPPTTRMGSGSTSSSNSLWVFDGRERPVGEPEAIAWPTDGYFPVQLEPNGRWSYTMPGANFDAATVSVRDGSGRSLSVDRHTPAYGYGDPTLVWQVDGLVTETGLPDRTYTVTVSGIERAGTTITRTYDVTLFDPTQATAPVTGRFVPVTPCRLVDTRTTNGFGPGASRTFRISGTGAVFAAQGGRPGGCGIPAEATAVEASVTAVRPSRSGYFRAWPAGSTPPVATFLNYTGGQNTTNTGTLTLGSAGGGELSVSNHLGTVDYVIDVQGYFAPPPSVPAGSVYVPITPCRVADTRATVAMGPGATRSWQVGGSGSGFATQGGRADGCGIPSAAVAVEASVHAVVPSWDGFLRAWPSDVDPPTATFLNYTRRQNTTNTGTIALATTGVQDLTVANYGGTTHFVVDVQGYFVAAASAPDGLDYVARTPCRVIDTRGGWPVPSGWAWPFEMRGGAGSGVPGSPAAGCGIPQSAAAVEASLTAIDPTASGYLRVWPGGVAQPTATFLNYGAGRNTTNTGAMTMGPMFQDVEIGSYGGAVHLVMDVNGYFHRG